MFSVSLLGGMSLSVHGRRLSMDLGPSGRLLAAYLFQYPGRAHRREQLAEMFWEERTAEQSRCAMNTALWRLRKLLAIAGADAAAALGSTAAEVVLDRVSSVLVDTHCFSEAVRGALAAATSRAQGNRAVLLEDAAERYAGTFLEGDDADWIITEREKLHSLYVRSLTELIRVHACNNDLESAISAARRVLAVDPFRERIVRTLTILLFMNGQRVQAIKELDRWKLALQKEIGVLPLPETVGLRTALVSGALCEEIPRLRREYFPSDSLAS